MKGIVGGRAEIHSQVFTVPIQSINQKVLYSCTVSYTDNMGLEGGTGRKKE